MEESSLKVKNNKYKIMHQALFERRLQEYYDYVKKHGKQPDKTVCFKDGRQMGHWKSGFLTIIKKVSQLGDERATYILNVKNITKKLSFDDKCIEVIKYLKENLKTPKKQANDVFSNGTKMGLWLYQEKRHIIFRNMMGDKYATALIYIVLEIDPFYFDTIIHNPKAKQEVNRIMVNYQFVKRK